MKFNREVAMFPQGAVTALTRIAFGLLMFAVGGTSLPARANTLFLTDPTTTGTITVSATSSGTAVGGSNPAADNAHAMGYDGPTTFTATYTITYAGTTVDTTKSTVTFKTTSYTSSGQPQTSDFTTLPITITGATFNMDGSIASFTFSSTDWYPNAAGEGITNNSLSGTITLSGASKYTASYMADNTGGTYTYVVTSTPLPATLPLLATGLGAIGLIGWRRKRKVQATSSVS